MSTWTKLNEDPVAVEAAAKALWRAADPRTRGTWKSNHGTYEELARLALAAVEDAYAEP